jgi:hypothetical protein
VLPLQELKGELTTVGLLSYLSLTLTHKAEANSKKAISHLKKKKKEPH